MILFADDTTILASDFNLFNLIDNTNYEFQKINDWFKANELIVNCEKTNCVYFSKKQNTLHNLNSMNIIMDGTRLTLSKHVKFLGITLDDQINFNKHRSEICNKISKCIGISIKLRPVLPEKQLFLLYNSLILPYLQYCNTTWASTGSTKLEPILKLQKKALRICTSSHFLAHSQPLFFRLKTLNVFDIHIYQIALIMFKNKSAILPPNISSLFQFNMHVHSYDTRSRPKLHYPKVLNERSLKLIRHHGPRIWNSLNNNISTCNSLSLFKYKMKLNLLSGYNH